MNQEIYTATEFRANIYQIIDAIEETGRPMLIKRHDKFFEVREKLMKNETKEPKKYRDLSKIKPLAGIMTEDADWYVSPPLYEWKPDDFL